MTERSPEIGGDPIDWHIVLVVNIISVLAFLIFLCKIIRTSQKNYGFFMILILTVVDLSYPVIKIITIYFAKNPIPISLLGDITQGMQGFKLDWNAAFSVYTFLVYQSFMQKRLFNFKKFMFLALVICILTTITIHLKFFMLDYYMIGRYSVVLYHTTSLTVAFHILQMIVPISITCIYYRKFYLLVRKSHQHSDSKKMIAKRILYSTFLPIICFGPRILYAILTLLDSQQRIPFQVLFPLLWMDLVLQYIWEFFNLWLYGISNNKDIAPKRENSERSILLSTKSSVFLEL